MLDPIRPAAIHQRWDALRNDPECDLSLDPNAVARYLSKKESDIVMERILESLSQLADYRVLEKSYHSGGGNAGAGDLATCEGLETFLVPAVEDAYPFSRFLRNYREERSDADGFVATFRDDLKGLLASWTKGKGEFSGKPYTDSGQLRKAIPPTSHPTYAPFNITETAAMACRVLIHVLTLKYKAVEEEDFQKSLGAEVLDDQQILKALSNAIDFLVEAFQKSITGDSTDERIANATWGGKQGSGWSWTASPPGTPPLAPMLFFTSAAVDAFAELELYLIRPARTNLFAESAPAVQQFWQEKQAQLRSLQLCVDMARRWTKETVLPNLAHNTGQHHERYEDQTTQVHYISDAADFAAQWQLAGLEESPLVYYNNVYALQILLWSFADRTDDGKRVDDSTKNMILGAITLLMRNYNRISVVREVLTRFDHKFCLPGKGIFSSADEKAKVEYLDAGFLPLLTRLLVLYVAYGVGDRNLLEPIIRDLYVDLLQERHRAEDKWSALWSTENVEMFSTQRAIQALTFYFAYAKGKELLEERGRGGPGDDGMMLINETGAPVVLKLTRQVPSSVERYAERTAVSQPAAVEGASDPARLFADKFGDSFFKHAPRTPGYKAPEPPRGDEDMAMSKQVEEFASTIYSDGLAGKIADLAAAETIVQTLASLISRPWNGKLLRAPEFDAVKRQYKELTGGAP